MSNRTSSAILSITLLTISTAFAQPPGLAAAIRHLDPKGPGHDAATTARKALTDADPKESLPLLAECIATAPSAHAWQALRVLHAVCAKADKAASAARLAAARQLSTAAIDSSDMVKDTQRQLRWLAVGALGHGNAEIASTAKKAIAESKRSEVRFAAALALAGLGKVAQPTIKKLIKDKQATITTRALAMCACGAMDVGGKSMKSSLKSILVDNKDPRAWMLSWTARAMTRRVAGDKVADKLWKTYGRKIANRHFQNKKVKFNFAAPVPAATELAMGALQAQGIFRLTSLPDQYCLPAKLDGRNLGNMVQEVMAHVANDVAKIRSELRNDAVQDLAQWRKRIRGPRLSWDFVRTMLSE